ncbi:MAG TPA: FHA domain-containing protein [Streptosporangiaceae bacterium]|nr:FHA domain-containing protein [Streptosporangiaceae bacterium]
MATCPAGHDSGSSDFCDVCGMRIGAPAGVPLAVPPAAAPPDTAAEPCPRCGTARSGQFCEACGFDFDAGQAPGPERPDVGSGRHLRPATWTASDSGRHPGPATWAASDSGRARGPATWTAVVSADRAYYDMVIAAGGPDAGVVQFPGYCPERRFPLTGPQVRIGRHSASRGLQPEIDLSGPPTDPGVSRLHAVLIAEPDGSWAVLDPGSENGTLVNDSEIATGVRVPLRDGDHIHLGAWTVLTIQAVHPG